MKITKTLAIGMSILMLGITGCVLQPAETQTDPITPVEEEEKKEEEKTPEKEEKKEEEKKEEEDKKPETTVPDPFGWETIDYSTPKATYKKAAFSITSKSGETGSFTNNNGVITLHGKQSGELPDEYTITGYFEGQIVNELKDNELVLNGAYIENNNASAIYAQKKLYVTAKNETTSYVISTGTSEEKIAALHSDKGLELGGKGTCYIASEIYHGVKATNIELKGSGTYYIQGTDKGAAINCNNLEVKEERNFTAYLINSKNGIKADETISIASGTFYFGNLETALKTDKAADDEAGKTKSHFINFTGGKFNYNNDDVDYFTSTDDKKYTITKNVVINKLTNLKTDE